MVEWERKPSLCRDVTWVCTGRYETHSSWTRRRALTEERGFGGDGGLAMRIGTVYRANHTGINDMAAY